MNLSRLISQWPVDWRDAYQERAAIKEYDGRMSRAHAEQEAERDIRRVAGGEEQ